MSEAVKIENALRNFVFVQGKIDSLKVEVEGMKAENENRKVRGESIAYGSDSFFTISNQILELSQRGF